MNSPEICTVENPSKISSAKRKLSSTTGDAERVVKRRAARACWSCRSRKVRCDILVNGERCTNCKLDNLECILLTSKRGKSDKSRKEGREWMPATSPASTRDTNIAATVVVDNQSSELAVHSPASPIPTPTTDEVPVCLTFDDEDARDMSESHVARDDSFEAPEAQGDSRLDQNRPQNNFQMDGWAHTSADLLHQALSAPSGPASASTGCFATDSPQELQLPSFIKRLPVDMDPEDVRFLARKGAFVVPEPELRAEILQTYIFSVHTFMPILDLKDFVDAVLNEGSGGQVSLLLFQAVMFAGLASLRPGIVQQTGCETLKQARNTFFARVRLLHDFDTEPDNMVILQSLLLMSFWYEKWNNRKHTWHWTGQALSLAQSMGLHRGTSAPGIPLKVQRSRRRLWWSLYIRDRLIALGTRRPMRIRDEEFDVPMLTVQDFDVGPLGTSFNVSPAGSPVGQGASQGKCLALMCIELAKLCICIGHVLSSQYTTLCEQTPLTSTLMVVPRRPHERAEGLMKCDEELQEWYQNLDPQVRRVALDSARGASTDCEGIPWSILHMIHLTSVSVLHSPQVLQPCLGGSEAAQARRYSREKVKETARKITKILHTMLRRCQVRFLPTSGIPAALSASLGHMLDIKSEDEDVRDASIFRFYQTMQVLQRLREIYASADSAVLFLASAVRKAGISAPIQLAAQATPGFMIAGMRKETSRPAAFPRINPSGDSVFAQLPRSEDTNQHLQESQTNPYAEYANGPRRTPAGPWQLFAMPDQHHGTFHDCTVSQSGANVSHLGATGSVSGASASQLSSRAPGAVGDGGTKEIENEQPPEMNEATLPDPLSYWVVNEDYLTVNGGLSHIISEEPISLNYDFCSDAFGLLDGLVRGADETDTIMVNSRSSAE